MNLKMSIVYYSAPDINKNICDIVSLDKLKYYSTNKPALPYIPMNEYDNVTMIVGKYKCITYKMYKAEKWNTVF